MVYQDRSSPSHQQVGQEFTGVCPKCGGSTEELWKSEDGKTSAYRCTHGHFREGKVGRIKTVYLVPTEEA